MGDIVERLRAIGDELSEDYYPTVYAAADEIQRLRVALALACNELFGFCDPLETSPHQLMAHFLDEVRDA